MSDRGASGPLRRERPLKRRPRRMSARGDIWPLRWIQGGLDSRVHARVGVSDSRGVRGAVFRPGKPIGPPSATRLSLDRPCQSARLRHCVMRFKKKTNLLRKTQLFFLAQGSTRQGAGCTWRKHLFVFLHSGHTWVYRQATALRPLLHI